MNQTPPWVIKPLVLEKRYTKPTLFKDKVSFAIALPTLRD